MNFVEQLHIQGHPLNVDQSHHERNALLGAQMKKEYIKPCEAHP